ncbi:MAG: HAD family hydrolase [Nanoarchaeota archaeon]|nr:HAD family hydrolase [Nanoarchaeota archaeon]MBU1322014.1 HAD family hydrolase [Nanoarchaeota archaeon]MBU1598099.1 HAD family hydrolase [Nanoarchaeota archaeon]MBU2441772.1 HAD family hydrolase [Nanoarchaeota archaeon]
MFRKKHIAKNIIVALDFDGCIAYGEKAKIHYANKLFGINPNRDQIVKATFPLGGKKYRELMDHVATEGIMEYELAPDVHHVLRKLYSEGFRFAIVTSRLEYGSYRELSACKKFCRYHNLPIKYFYNTNDNPKEIICRKLHSRAIIDDTLFKLRDLMNSDMNLFFLRQRWNSHESVHLSEKNMIFEIGSWQEFYEKLHAMRRLHESVCLALNIDNNWSNLSKIVSFIRQNPGKANEYYRKYSG